MGLKIAAAAAVLLGGSSLLFYLNRTGPVEPPAAQALAVEPAKLDAAPTGPIPAPVAKEIAAPAVVTATTNEIIPADAGEAAHELPTQLAAQSTKVTLVPEDGYQFIPRGILSGLITDVNTLEPIEGLQVCIGCRQNDGYQQTKTDPNGMYWFSEILDDGQYEIEFESLVYITPERWGSTSEYIQLNKDAQIVRHYQFQKGCKVKAEVVNEYGQPLKEFSIHAAYVSDFMGRGPKRDVRTDSEGKAKIGGLKPETYQVSVMGKGYAPAYQTIKFDSHFQEKELRFVLQPGISVFGRAVCEDGLPASGWEIAPEPAWWHSGYCVPDFIIDPEGNFELKHILPGDYTIRLFIPKEGGSSGLWSVRGKLPPDTGFLEIIVPYASPSQRVSQKITIQYLGEPPNTGFWISAVSTDGNQGNIYVEKGQTEFEMEDLVPGLYTFEIDREPIKMKFQNMKIPHDNLVLQIPTRKQTVLRGKVVDRETSLPIEKFTINTVAYEDPQGEFAYEVYGTESRRVRVFADGYLPVMESPDMVPDANEPTLIAMTPVKAGGIVEGFIVNEEGLPVPQVKIQFRFRQGDSRLAAVSDAEGRFILNDLQQDASGHWLVFEHPDYAPLTRQILGEENTVRQVRIVLSQGGTIEGFVYDETGVPLPGTPLYFLDESIYSYWEEGRARLGKVITDHRGCYRIEHMPEVLCYGFREDPDSKLGVVTTSVLPRKGRTVRLDFGGLSTASGTILQNNRPVPKLSLMIKGSPGAWETAFMAYTRTDEAGRFAFRGIPAGSRYLSFEIAGQYGHERWMELGRFDFPEGRDVDLGAFTIDLAQAAVSLTGNDPNELPGQYDVSLCRFDETRFSRTKTGKMLARHAADDPYTFSLLPPGKYEAVASREGYPSIRKAFEVATEERSCSVEIRIPQGSALVAGTVVLNNQDRRSLNALTLYNQEQTLTFDFSPDNDGRFQLEHLPPGEYAVTQTHYMQNRQSPLIEFSVKPAKTKEIRFSLSNDEKPEGYLCVLPVTSEGLPLPGTRVTLERNGQILHPNFEAEKSISFAGEPGSWTLRAEYPGYQPVTRTVTMKNIKECSMQETLDPVVIPMYQ